MAGEVVVDALVEGVERRDRLGRVRAPGCLVDEWLDRGDLLGVVRVGVEVGDGEVVEEEGAGGVAVACGLCEERPAGGW